MTFAGDIQGAMRDAISVFGSSWTYRTVTSAPDAEAKTYSSTSTMTAQLLYVRVEDLHDQDRDGWMRRKNAVIKVSDAIVLNPGDQAIDPSGKHWYVEGQDDATDMDGIVRYRISRDIPRNAAPEQRGRE